MIRRALVVHPDPSVGGRIEDECERAGFTVVHVRDGERAIDRFVQEPAEVLVVDVELPGRDGAATVESMRWAPGGDSLVVILTGTTSTAGRLAAVARELSATATLPGANPRLGPLRGVLAGLRAKPAPSERQAELGATLPLSLGWPLPGGDRPSSGFEDELLTQPGSSDSVPTPARGVSVAGLAPRPEQAPTSPSGQASRAEPAVAPRVSGALSETPFARLLTRLAEQRASGVLHLSAPDLAAVTTAGGAVQKRVYFRAGVPTHVESNRLDETLGAMLVSAGHVPAATLDRALGRVRAREGRLGGILIAMSALGPHALREALELQQRERIFDIFQWSEGSFHFIDEPVTPPESVALELSLVELIFEGVVGRLSPPLALAYLAPHAKRHVVPDARRLRAFLNRPLPDFAQRMLAQLDGQTRVSALLATGPSRRAYMAQLLFALECVGAVAFRDTPQTVDEASGMGPSAGAVAGAAEGLAELDRLAALLDAERWAEALGVMEDDDARTIEEAAENLDARLRPLAETGAASREVRTRAYGVLAGIARARRRLLDAPSREEEDRPEEKPAKRPTDRPTVAGVPLARDAAAELDTNPLRNNPPAPAVLTPESLAAPTFAEGIPTFLGEVLASARRNPSAGPSWDDLTLPEPSFDDVTTAGDLDLPLPLEAYRPESEPRDARDEADGEARARAASDRDAIPTRAIELSEDQALTAPAGVKTRPEVVLSAAAPAEAEDETEAEDEAEAAEAPARPSGAPEKPRKDPRELDLEVERMLQAERAFRRGKRALKQERLAEAIEHFSTAERLCPHEGEFLAALGEALWREDPQTPRAHELLERGCDLAPHLAGPHLALGALRQAAGDAAGARVAYERALAANPNEAAAVEGLRLLESS